MMNDSYRKHIANIITLIRIPCAVGMLLSKEMNSVFYIFFLIGGLSDAIDGYVARRLGTQSRNGAILDSIADLIFFGSSLFILFKTNGRNMNDAARLMLRAVFIFRIFCYIIGYAKFHMIAALHTYLNKATAVAIFGSIAVIPYTGISIPCIVTCTIALLAVTEEIIITLLSHEPLSDIKGLMSAVKKIERRN